MQLDILKILKDVPSQTIGLPNMANGSNLPKDSQGCHRDPFLCVPCVPCVPCRFDICLFGGHGCNRYRLSNASWACHVGTHCKWSNGISLSHAHNPYIIGTNLFDCREGKHCKMCIYALICHVDKAHIKCNHVEAFHEDSCDICDNLLSCDHEDSRCRDCMIAGLSHVRRHCLLPTRRRGLRGLRLRTLRLGVSATASSCFPTSSWGRLVSCEPSASPGHRWYIVDQFISIWWEYM